LVVFRFFFFSSRRRHTRCLSDWSSDVCSSDLATLVITGDHDSRVMPMHSFKFAAALQTAQAGPAPVLLAVDLSSGHGGGETVTRSEERRVGKEGRAGGSPYEGEKRERCDDR